MSALADEIKAAVREVLREELPRALRDGASVLRIAANSDDAEAMSLSDCARLTGYSVGYLRREIRLKRLAAMKGAKEWRVRRGDLIAWQGKPKGAASVVDLDKQVDKILGGRGRP